MILTLDITFPEGEIVYLKTDKDADPRIVVGFDYRFGKIQYALLAGTKLSYHYEPEITTDKTFAIPL